MSYNVRKYHDTVHHEPKIWINGQVEGRLKQFQESTRNSRKIQIVRVSTQPSSKNLAVKSG
jgi:hypothetical protein